jgi:DHA1 family inner membrane transport protein
VAAKIDEVGTGEHSSSRGGVVMTVLFIIFFLGNSDNQMISPLLPLIARDFQSDVGEVGGMIIPAYALAAAVAALLVGPISDKYGRRRFLLSAAVLFGLSLLAISIVKDPFALAALRVFTGFASGTFSTCSIAYVADFFPYKRRGMAMSVVQAGYFAALVMGVPVAALVARWQGWRASFGLFGMLSLVTFVLIIALLPEDKHAMAEQNLSQRVARRFDNMRVLFESRERVAAIAAAFFVSGGFIGFFAYLGSWLSSPQIGLATHEVGLFFIIVGIASLAGAVVAGPVADRIGKRGLSILSTLVLAAMLVVIPRFGWGPLLLATFLTAALAFAFRQGPLQALATEMVPRRVQGAFVAVRNTASQIGIALATVACGLLYDSVGYGAVGLFSGVMTLGAAACIFMMREPHIEEAID